MRPRSNLRWWYCPGADVARSTSSARTAATPKSCSASSFVAVEPSHSCSIGRSPATHQYRCPAVPDELDRACSRPLEHVEEERARPGRPADIARQKDIGERMHLRRSTPICYLDLLGRHLEEAAQCHRPGLGGAVDVSDEAADRFHRTRLQWLDSTEPTDRKQPFDVRLTSVPDCVDAVAAHRSSPLVPVLSRPYRDEDGSTIREAVAEFDVFDTPYSEFTKPPDLGEELGVDSERCGNEHPEEIETLVGEVAGRSKVRLPVVLAVQIVGVDELLDRARADASSELLVREGR